jgi:uncharacterized membrane protein
MKKVFPALLGLVVFALSVSTAFGFNFFGGKNFTTLTPKDNVLIIPVKDINDGSAHYFKVKASDGTIVSFFALKSADGIIRAAIDACDVCYKAGKGYTREGDFMVCENCGQRFASNRINEVKGGCNPAPLERVIDGEQLVIKMADIGKNSWYCKYKPQ